MTDSRITPIHPNPYIVGNPVRDPSMFFGREADFKHVQNRFHDSDRGGLLVFCGERRSGKTSILFQILDGRLGPEFLPVLIDMQSMAIETAADFFSNITIEILRTLDPHPGELDPPDYSAASNTSAEFQKFIDDLLSLFPEKKPILLIDEYELMESKIESGVLSDQILYTFSNLIEHRPVFFIFTGSQHLEQRRKEYWKILGKSIHKRITYLDKSDALQLITKPVEGRVEYAENAVERIYRLAAGQPFYTQAICQSLVDTLNEHHTRRVDDQILSSVIASLVNNPLPQMLFLWEGLPRDEKLTLALLAEELQDDADFAKPEELTTLIAKRKYPLKLDRPRIATALARLFKNELLLTHPDDVSKGYAFRMDLWRGWIRRMHSVWQVMQEEHMRVEPPPPFYRRRSVWLSAALGPVLALVVWSIVRPPDAEPPVIGRVVPPFPGRGTISVSVNPSLAEIVVNGEPRGTGSYSGLFAADEPQEFLVTASGYVDTTFTVSVARDSMASRFIALRNRTGAIEVTTTPSGASVRHNGSLRGTTPLTMRRLSVNQEHSLVVSLRGYEPVHRTIEVRPDTTLSFFFSLTTPPFTVVITTSPPGARISVNGNPVEEYPATLSGLNAGRHRIQIEHEDYVPIDTLLTLSASTPQVHFPLELLPPGILVVSGNRPGTIYIDGVLVVPNVMYSGPRELRPGTHEVQVVLFGGRIIDKTVHVRSGQLVEYDYTEDQVRVRPMAGDRGEQ